jgi:SanA protein
MIRRLVLLACGALLAAVCLAGFAWFLERRQAWDAEARLTSDPSKLPEMDVGLVLGTGPFTHWRDGHVTTNIPFAYRLDAAAELWRAGKVRYLIVSGRRDGAYDEPTVMRDGLIERGVPAKAIFPDFGGNRTFTSILRVRGVSGVKRIVIVSQPAHVERALYIARSLGIDAWGLAAREEGPVRLSERLTLIAAAFRAWLDVVATVPAGEAP